MKKIFLIFIVLLLLTPALIKADGLVKCDTNCTFQDLLDLIPAIVNGILYWIVIPGAALCLAIGGIMLLISGGSPNLASLGKKILLATVIGMVLAFGSWIIVNFILKTIGAPGL